MTGDPGRKAEVILDTGARAGLSAEGARIEHEHGKPLGGGIDGRRKPRRSGSDDRDIIDFAGGGRTDHPEMAGQFGL